MTRSVSVVIPVYNESLLLGPSVLEIHKYLDATFADFEILLIESGSTDGSAKICDDLASELRGVKTIHEGARKGFGSAVKLGYRRASKECVCLCTADIPFPLDVLERAVPLLDDAECVLSYRSDDPRSLGRKIQSFVYNKLVQLILGVRVRHVNSAFKLFRTELIRTLPIETNGWFLDAEVVARLHERGSKFSEIGVPLIDRAAGRSSVSMTTPLKLLRDLLRFRFCRHEQSSSPIPEVH